LRAKHDVGSPTDPGDHGTVESIPKAESVQFATQSQLRPGVPQSYSFHAGQSLG
jgi:hypothetical protein